MIEIKGVEVRSTSGKYVHRLGTEVYFKCATVMPHETEADFEEVDAVPAYNEADYEAQVAALVRERYTADDEFALQRKAINLAFTPMTLSEDVAEKTRDEYAEYNAYVEQCKVRAREMLSEGKNNLNLLKDEL